MFFCCLSLLLFYISSKINEEEFKKKKTFDFLQNIISLRRFSFQKRLKSDIEINHLISKLVPQKTWNMSLPFSSLLLRLNSFNLHYINKGWKESFNDSVKEKLFLN